MGKDDFIAQFESDPGYKTLKEKMSVHGDAYKAASNKRDSIILEVLKLAPSNLAKEYIDLIDEMVYEFNQMQDASDAIMTYVEDYYNKKKNIGLSELKIQQSMKSLSERVSELRDKIRDKILG